MYVIRVAGVPLAAPLSYKGFHCHSREAAISLQSSEGIQSVVSTTGTGIDR
jgi:hypothetical protein